MAGVGLPFLVVRLASQAALERAAFNDRVMAELERRGISPDILLYTSGGDGADFHARMFAPLDGVPEDPATGSANAALAALLADCDPREAGEFRWRIVQGREMGRPSVLDARVVKRGGVVAETRIGGDSVLVAEGELLTG